MIFYLAVPYTADPAWAIEWSHHWANQLRLLNVGLVFSPIENSHYRHLWCERMHHKAMNYLGEDLKWLEVFRRRGLVMLVSEQAKRIYSFGVWAEVIWAQENDIQCYWAEEYISSKEVNADPVYVEMLANPPKKPTITRTGIDLWGDP